MNLIKVCSSVMAFPLVFAPSALFGDTYAWDATEKPASLGGGTTDGATLEYSGDAIRLFYAYPTSEDIVLKGDAMSFADGAKIGLAANGALVFSNALASAGAISFAFGSPEPAKWDGNGTLLKKSADIIVFPGANLNSYAFSSCIFNKSGVTGNSVTKGLSGNPYHVVQGSDEDGNATLAAQLQCQDGWNIKCVKVMLTQHEEGIGAKVVYCRSISRDYDYAALGLDFESGSAGITERQVTSENPYAGATAFDVEYLELDCITDNGTIALASALTAPGGATVETGAKVIAEGSTVLSDSTSVAWTINGELDVRNVGTADLAGVIAGSGALIVGPSTESALSVAVSGENKMDLNGRIRVYGTEACPTVFTVKHTKGLPKGGQIDVFANATLDLAVADGSFNGIQEGFCPIVVHPGGYLKATANGIGGGRQQLTLDAATAEIYGAGWSAGFPNQVVFSNASTLKRTRTSGTGLIAVGSYNADCQWHVMGAGVSRVTAQLQLSADTKGNFATFTVDVDEGAEFAFDAGMTFNDTSAARNIQLRKTGTGMVTANATCAYSPDWPLLVSGGTWKLGASSVMNAADNVELAGGGLTAAAATVNSMGTLKLSGTSTIVLEAGSTLNIADSSAAAWADGAMLSVTAAEGASIAFGSSATGLTPAQLSRIKMNGHKVVLGEDGALKEYVPGLILLLR